MDTSLTKEELMKKIKEREKYFQKVKGILRKHWTYNEKTKTAHEIF